MFELIVPYHVTLISCFVGRYPAPLCDWSFRGPIFLGLVFQDSVFDLIVPYHGTLSLGERESLDSSGLWYFGISQSEV